MQRDEQSTESEQPMMGGDGSTTDNAVLESTALMIDPLIPATPGQNGPLDEETVQSLFRRMRGPIELLRNHDRSALRDHLVLAHTPLVEHCARNFIASGEPVEDLVQEGYVGLIKAIDRFDPDKGVRFSTYAYHLIGGEIRHYLRDLGRIIHEPGWHFELRQRIARVTDQLTQQLGRPPQPEEIAESLNVSVEQVRNVLKNQNTLAVERLDQTDSDADGDDTRGMRAWDNEMAAATKPVESRVDDQLMLGEALPQLKDLEKQVVTLFFFEELSKTEIARRLDISVNYAAYLIKRGVGHLREIIEAGDVVTPALSPQQARATQLLAQLTGAKAASASSRRKTERPGSDRRGAGIPTAARTAVASFAEFAVWVDEEVQRAARYAEGFGVMWLQVRNWDEAMAPLDKAAVKQATSNVRALTRRCCRGVDKIASLETTSFPGLHLLILMPHSGEQGVHAGDRWLQGCKPSVLLPNNAELLAMPDATYAFALFPRDGKTSDDLFRFLGSKLRG